VDVPEGTVPEADAAVDEPGAEDAPADEPGSEDAPLDGPEAGDAPPDEPGAEETVPDAAPDEPGEVEPEAGFDADAGPDVAPDAAEAGDGPADGWAALTITLTDAGAYVNMMPPGPATGIVYFTVRVENTGPAAATGFRSPRAAVDEAGGAGTFFTVVPSLTLPGGAAFDGVVEPGAAAILDGYGRVEDPAVSRACGEDAKLTIDFVWDGAATVSRSGDVFSISCPVK
jgi:hypothetical protein